MHKIINIQADDFQLHFMPSLGYNAMANRSKSKIVHYPHCVLQERGLFSPHVGSRNWFTQDEGAITLTPLGHTTMLVWTIYTTMQGQSIFKRNYHECKCQLIYDGLERKYTTSPTERYSTHWHCENLSNCEKQKTKSSLPEDSSITLPQPQWI